MLGHLGSPSGSVRVPPYSTGICSGSMYFCRTSFQLAGGVEGSRVWGGPAREHSPPPGLGFHPGGGAKAEGDMVPQVQLPPQPGKPRGGGADSHPRTTTFLRVSSLRKCLMRL